MRFTKNLRFDLKNGILRNKILLLCPVMIAGVTFVDFISRLYRLRAMQMLNLKDVFWGDYWFFLYGGMKEYIPAPDNPFVFPVVWILIFVTPSFLVLNYPMKNMQDIGKQILVEGKSRLSWWLSKCCWNAMSTILFHLIAGWFGVVFCLLAQIPLTLDFNLNLQNIVFEFGEGIGVRECSAIPVLALMLPVLISVAVNLMQMTFSLFVGPMFSFLAVSAFFILSAYLTTPYVLGNYAMLLRHSWFIEGGVFVNTGVIVSVLVIVLALIIGGIRFWHYDILDKD